MTSSTTLKLIMSLNLGVKKLSLMISEQQKTHEKGHLEILQNCIEEIVQFSNCKYGFIGILDKQDGVLNFKYLLEKKIINTFNPFGNFSIPNPLTINDISKAYQYLKVIPSLRSTLYHFDIKRASKNLPWYSNILIPIFNDNEVVAVLGLNDRKKGFSKQFELRLAPIINDISNLINTFLNKTNVSTFEQSDIFNDINATSSFDMMAKLDELWLISNRNFQWTHKLGATHHHIMDHVFDQDYKILELSLLNAQKTQTTQSCYVRFKRKKQILKLAMKVHYNSELKNYHIYGKDITQQANVVFNEKVKKDNQKILDFCFKNPIINHFL